MEWVTNHWKGQHTRFAIKASSTYGIHIILVSNTDNGKKTPYFLLFLAHSPTCVYWDCHLAYLGDMVVKAVLEQMTTIVKTDGSFGTTQEKLSVEKMSHCHCGNIFTWDQGSESRRYDEPRTIGYECEVEPCRWVVLYGMHLERLTDTFLI